jgi:hypothetical protein
MSSRATPAVDVTVSRRIAASPRAIAEVMFDPGRDPDWMNAVRSAGRVDSGTGVGAKAWQKGRFLGREIAWTTTVSEYEPQRLLVMDIEGGPFVGSVTYCIEGTDSGSMVSIRNTGEPKAFRWLPVALTVAAMRKALANDLQMFATLVEPSTSADPSVA